MRRYQIVVVCMVILAGGLLLRAAESEKSDPFVETLQKLPALTTPEGQEIVAGLVAQSPDSVKKMLGIYEEQKGEIKSKAEFALHGMAFYVARPGAEAERRKVADALKNALTEKYAKETKRFILRQLQLCGGYESVSVVETLLEDPDYCDPAARVLIQIGTPQAKAALAAALKDAEGFQRVVFVRALGKLQAAGCAPMVLAYATSGNKELRQAALWALANSGSSKAAGVFAEALKGKKGLEEAQTIQWYLLLARRLSEKGYKASAETICAGVKALGKSTNRKHVVTAAVDTLIFVRDGAGFEPLFNGYDLVGWNLHGRDFTGGSDDPKGYFVNDDGVVECSAQGGGKLLTSQEYADFVLRFEFKLTENANNGLGVRAPIAGDAAYNAMELQILDNTNGYFDRLRPYQYHGSIYDVVPAQRGWQKPVGEWNRQEVIADGARITVILNGHVIVDVDLQKVWEGLSEEKRKRHTRENGGLLNKKGHIGFLGHGAQLWFRNIRIKEL